MITDTRLSQMDILRLAMQQLEALEQDAIVRRRCLYRNGADEEEIKRLNSEVNRRIAQRLRIYELLTEEAKACEQTT